MRFQLKPSIATLFMAGVFAAPAFAATTTSTGHHATQAKKHAATQPSLAAKVDSLEREVAALRNQQAPYASPVAHIYVPGKHEVAEPLNLPFDPDLPGQSFVTTGPYAGNSIQFSGSNLVVNTPNINTDLQLLRLRKKLLMALSNISATGLYDPHHSHLMFSGVIETQANYTNHGGSPSTTDIDLTNVEIDATVFGPSDWILGFIGLNYDGAEPYGSQFTSVSRHRVSNSRVFVNKAFVTIGDLARSPYYGTFGQIYVPFGTYSSVMVSDTLTKLIGRTKARSILLGFNQPGDNAFFGSAYIFRGDSHAHSVPKVSNGGLNLTYKLKYGPVSGQFGGGVIANIADSVGMQEGANFQFAEQIQHRVPAYDLRGILSLGEHIDLIGEWITASKEFNVNDLSYNGHGAKPNAIDLEASYSFPIFDNKPSSIGIGYGKSNQALAMGIPLTRTSLVFNTSLLRNTLQSLEFRRDMQYANSDVATGPIFSTSQETGKSDNSVTAQFDFYF